MCAAIAIVMMIGMAAVSLIVRSRATLCRAEFLALAYLAGTGLVSLEMLFFYFLKEPLRPALLIAPWSVLIICAAAFLPAAGRRRSAAAPCCVSAPRVWSPLETFFGCGIALEVLYAFFRALIRPIESYDAIAIYAIKAKMLFLSRALNADFFTGIRDLFPHPDYPLNIPCIEAFYYMMMRALNDQLVKLIFPLFFVATLALLYCGVRRFASRAYALLFVFILATIPQFTAYATNAYLDLPLGCYVFASALLLFRWCERPGAASVLVLSAVMAGLAGWTKNEGLLYCIVSMAVLGVCVAGRAQKMSGKDFIAAAAYPVIIIGIVFPWLWIKRIYGIANSEIDVANANPVYILHQAHKIWPVLYEFQKQVFGPKKWLLVWPLAIAAVTIFWRKAFAGQGRLIALWLGLALCGYVLFYLISYVDVVFFVSKTWARFLLHFLPVVVYWVAWTLKDEIRL